MEPIVTVRRRLEWFRHVRRDETEMIRSVLEMKMDGQRPVGRPRRRKDTVSRDLKARKIRDEWDADGERDGKVSARPATQYRETAAKGEIQICTRTPPILYHSILTENEEDHS